MIVVSDSGPLIHLSRVKKLEVLRDFFSEIYIPDAVYEELTSKKGMPGYEEVKSYTWIKRKRIDGSIAFLMDYLDKGESEAILLAKELDADLLLIDDLAGRRISRTHDIEVMGTLGILDRAANKDINIDLEKVIKELRNKGFWMDDDLFEKLMEK